MRLLDLRSTQDWAGEDAFRSLRQQQLRLDCRWVRLVLRMVDEVMDSEMNVLLLLHLLADLSCWNDQMYKLQYFYIGRQTCTASFL